jgi:uncharacterized protein
MLTIITKPTENCNSNCVYCSVNDKSMKKEVMSDEVLTLLFTRIREFLAGSEESVNITWHGGEPMLVGTAFYEKVHRIQERIAGDLQNRICHSMQSNLTILSDGFFDVFKKLNIDQVGSSFEFLPNVRGIGKKVNSDLYERRFFQSVEKLEKWKIRWGVIYVVTSKSVGLGEDVLNYLINLVNQSGGIRLNPLYLEGEARKDDLKYLGVTAEQFGHFLGKCFVSWYPRRKIYPLVQPFDGFLNYILGISNTLCCDEAGTCGSSHLGVDPQGNIYQCGRSMDTKVLKYGHLETHDFQNVFRHELKDRLNNRSQFLSEAECRDCRFFKFCHGGCPVDGFIYRDDWFKKTIWCEARKIFLEQYFEPTLNLRLGDS